MTWAEKKMKICFQKECGKTGKSEAEDAGEGRAGAAFVVDIHKLGQELVCAGKNLGDILRW